MIIKVICVGNRLGTCRDIGCNAWMRCCRSFFGHRVHFLSGKCFRTSSSRPSFNHNFHANGYHHHRMEDIGRRELPNGTINRLAEWGPPSMQFNLRDKGTKSVGSEVQPVQESREKAFLLRPCPALYYIRTHSTGVLFWQRSRQNLYPALKVIYYPSNTVWSGIQKKRSHPS